MTWPAAGLPSFHQPEHSCPSHRGCSYHASVPLPSEARRQQLLLTALRAHARLLPTPRAVSADKSAAAPRYCSCPVLSVTKQYPRLLRTYPYRTPCGPLPICMPMGSCSSSLQVPSLPDRSCCMHNSLLPAHPAQLSQGSAIHACRRRAVSSLPGPALKERNKRLPTSAPLKQPKVPELSSAAASRAALKRPKTALSSPVADQARHHIAAARAAHQL